MWCSKKIEKKISAVQNFDLIFLFGGVKVRFSPNIITTPPSYDYDGAGEESLPGLAFAKSDLIVVVTFHEKHDMTASLGGAGWLTRRLKGKE